MDEEESPLHPENFPVSDALAEAAESFRDFAAEKGHPLDIKIQPGLTYCGDEYAIRQLASILLDNAIKYALPDSQVCRTGYVHLLFAGKGAERYRHPDGKCLRGDGSEDPSQAL